jgi:hypothetical protein
MEKKMKDSFRTGVWASLLAALATMTIPGAANAAQNYRSCGWPMTFSAVGNETMYAPDTFARYYAMNFDASHRTMTIKGRYPHARYFSFVVYDSPNEAPADVAGKLLDQQISPDPGSGANPFVHDGAEGTYTVTLSRKDPTSGNVIHVGSDFAWVAMRIYVPSEDRTQSGNSLTGGVPLPTVFLDNQPLDKCSPIQKLQDVRAFFNVLFPPGFDLIGNEGTPTDDRLWFGTPRVTPIRLMPNPDNKYIVMLPGDHYQSGRLIVIHGKAPGTPFTYDGSPIWQPARGFQSVDIRYWSMCNTDFALPIGLVQCTSDISAPRQDGFYTIVLSDDLVRPSWLRPNITWMPYGDTSVPKLVFFRNMLGEHFPFSIQAAHKAGCTFEFNLPHIPVRADVAKSGKCAQQVMKDYYPVAVWCDESTFKSGGWQACIKPD